MTRVVGPGGVVSCKRRSIRSVAVAVAAALLCLGLAGCSIGSGSSEDGAAAARQTLTLARAEFARAARALLAGDRGGFLRSLPGDGSARSASAREALGDVYDTLSPLPWRSFSFSVSPAGKVAGLYRIEGSGQLGSAGPPDRLAVLRYLELGSAAGGTAVLADETPETLRRRYLMALHDPLALRRPGLLVLADRRARARARRVMAAAERARPRLALLGVDTRPEVLVTVYGSAEDVRDALGISAATGRLVFFSHASLRVADEAWPIYDVAVMGPWLRDLGMSMDDVLTHELAHAYTVRWFHGVKHPPSLLVEGIAEAAEGLPQAPSLREEVKTGDQLWPLPESFGAADVWDGADPEGVTLGYEVGGSLVDYVVSRWGAGRLRRFAEAVAGAEATQTGMDAAMGGVLGVSWRQFYAGWRRYVLGGG
jgi:hypothetical protein